jgi:DNA mismatch endonuclease (patch repair protein)
MSRVKGKDTGIEKLVRSELHQRGLRFRKHVKELPGKPDIVFPRSKVVVFIDGDFWHGYRLPLWEHKLIDSWKHKITATRQRDATNFKKLRRNGWQVIRIWQHQIEQDLHKCVDRIVLAINSQISET